MFNKSKNIQKFRVKPVFFIDIHSQCLLLINPKIIVVIFVHLYLILNLMLQLEARIISFYWSIITCSQHIQQRTYHKFREDPAWKNCILKFWCSYPTHNWMNAPHFYWNFNSFDRKLIISCIWTFVPNLSLTKYLNILYCNRKHQRLHEFSNIVWIFQ